MVQVALPGGFRDGETLLGLLGTPNEDTWVIFWVANAVKISMTIWHRA
jgi:hypothetical protein